MAHIGKLPTFQRLVTDHNEKGQAILSKKIDFDVPIDTKINNGDFPFMLSYTTTDFPVDMNNDKDIDAYKAKISEAPGLVQSSGTVLRAVDFAPGKTCAMHRTVSLDYGIVMIGDIELVLDSGEKKAMKSGDICIQRGTMHAWRNMSETEWARMLFVLQPSKPLERGGEKMEEELADMTGVRAST